MLKKFFSIVMAVTVSLSVFAQQQLTREQVLAMSTEQLSELSLEDLMRAVEVLGVTSVDELFALIMNKNVSSASKEDEDSFTSPLSSTVITRGEMRTYGVTSLEEAFRLIPGMIVSEKTNGIYDVQMRGLSNIPDNNMILYTENANILVMIDGRIVHNYAMGAPSFENLTIGIEDVERIEVVRGAASALYGPNAINGVVNIITTKPDQSNDVVSGSLQAGNKMLVGDFALRQTIGSKVAVGFSCNMQVRQRDSSTIPFLPQEGYYVDKTQKLLASGVSFSKEEMDALVAEGKLYNVGDEGLSVSDLFNLYSSTTDMETGRVSFYSTTTDYERFFERYPEPDLSRKSYGANGYFTFTPSADVRLDLTGGFQYVFNLNTPVGNEIVAFRDREIMSGFGNLNGTIKDFRFLVNYSNGPADYCVGTIGLKVQHTHTFNVQADYDFNVGDLLIRPSLSYQFIRYRDPKPTFYDFGNGIEEMSGFFGYYGEGENSADLTNFSPSLRLDYKHDALRLIGAFRTDKTNLPDKWNPSWQFAASYQAGEKNFIRLVYGRSFRSATFVNSSSKYNWRRDLRANPQQMLFVGNEESPLVHIDNFEIGYRLRPTEKLLIDAEAFYSISTDYGELKANESVLTLTRRDLQAAFTDVIKGKLSPMDLNINYVEPLFKTKAFLRYDAVPFKVHQVGISLNADWIISPKLIAKFNVNMQRTTIDNYFRYSQSREITRQLQESYRVTTATLTPVITELLFSTLMAEDGQEYLNNTFGRYEANDMAALRNQYKAMSPEDQAAMIATLQVAASDDPSAAQVAGVGNPLAAYYALKYGVEYNRPTASYYFGSSVEEDYPRENNYHHKATPAIYGMVGLIYKPSETITVSGFANLIGKREYTTLFGTTEVDPRLTINLKVGYKPVKQCEVFLNAHNLLNTKEREFIFTDKVGGIYSFGVNYNL